MSNVSEKLKRQAAWHAEQADRYAERSHKAQGRLSDGVLSDAYSSLSEAHHNIAERLTLLTKPERGSEMGKHAEEHALDIDFVVARSLHRVVRAMHDGECPKCHWLFESETMRGRRVVDPNPVITKLAGSTAPASMDMVCPNCKFTITDQESIAVIAAFAPVMAKNLEVFELWRASRSSK